MQRSKPAEQLLAAFERLYPEWAEEAEQEWRFHPRRKWRFDFAWPEIMLAVEVHGGCGRHMSFSGFRRDREKMNTAQTMGWTVLEVLGPQISRCPECVADAIVAVGAGLEWELD